MELDLRELLRIARRQGWIVLLIVVVAGAAAFVAASRQVEQFSASARLLVLGSQDESSNSYLSQQVSKNLIATYRSLVDSDPLLKRVIAELDLPYSVPELGDKVTVSVIADTFLIDIAVTDSNPQQAARIATSLAEQFKQYIDEQSADAVTLSASVEIANPARVPTEPFEPRPLFSLTLGLFVGLLIGIGLVALLEFMANTVKPEMDIQALAGAPVLATIASVPKLQAGGGQVYAISRPRASVSEALRLLRTNLEFAAASGPLGSLTITSPRPGEGKSTTAANLGVVMAQSGMTAVIIDADLRKPSQAEVFGIPNDSGLTSLLRCPNQNWRDVARKVALPGLLLVPSGPLPPNPSDLVSADRFKAVLEQVQADVDIVIVDSPPILSASDALAISAHTDGVVLVCHSHKTRIEALRHAADLIHHGGIRLVGVVLNREKSQQGASYYGEYYEPVAVTGD